MARNSWFGRLAVALVAIWLHAVVAHLATSADEQPAKPRWNVLLRDWQVVGPFAKPSEKDGGPELKLLENETEISPARPVSFNGEELKWKRSPGGVVDFPAVLRLKGKKADHAVAYARTEFTAPRAMRAKLSIGFDDSIAVWLNGEEIFRDDMVKTSCTLDQQLLDVELREGSNVLLLKVGQERLDWAAIVRLLPATAERPDGHLLIDMPDDRQLDRLPTLTFEAVGEDGTVLATEQSDGFRLKEPKGVGYAVYFADSVEGATQVRVRGAGGGLQPVDANFTMEQFASGDAKFKLAPSAPLVVNVLDQKSGKPVQGAVFQFNGELAQSTSDLSGRAEIADFPALVKRFWVAAPGYLPKEATAPRKANGVATVKLQPGGHVLKGRVVSKGGEPLSGAAIRAGWSNGYEPIATSDDDGQFEIPGLRGERGSVSPTIVCEGFVAKDGFGQKLDDDGVTEVEYQLDPGAVVVGRVVNKETGEPAAEVTITVGHDRFGSNVVNPEAKTDANGVYRLTGVAPGSTFIHAFSERFAPAMTQVSAQLGRETSCDFEVEPGGDVVGKVVDPERKPLENVWIVTDTWNGARMFRRETRSAADGSFRLAHMPATPVEVHVMKQDYVSDRNFQATPGSHEIVLKPVLKHRIHFQLADVKKPPTAKQLSLQRGYQFPGNDRVSWNDESYLLRQYDAKKGLLTLSNGEPTTAKLSWRFRVPGYQDEVIEDLSDAAEAKEFDLRFKRLATKRGVVVAADDGVPLGGVHVLLVNKQDRFRPDHYVQYDPHVQRIDRFTGVRTTTDERGQFELPESDALAESSIVLLSESGWAYLENAEALLSAEPCELPMPAGGVIEGVAEIAGAPEANADIQLNWIPPDESQAWDLPWGCGGECTTDAEGRFRFEGLGPGRYRIARSRGFDSPGSGSMSMHLAGDEIILLPGQTLVHNLVRPSGHHIEGVTVGPDGKPLGDCIVSATRSDDQRQRVEAVRADGEGRFILPHLPEGSYELSAQHYATTATATCGLGDQDFGGQATVNVPAGKEVTLKLVPQSRGQLTSSGPTIKGSVPPDFTATPLDGSDAFTLSDQWGKVVAIDFWATWCGPCMAVMPQLKELHEKYKDRDDVVFITVSLDNKEEDLRKVMKREGLEFPVFFAGKAWSDEIARSFGVTAIPSSFVIGRDGRFAAEKMHGAQLAAAVEAAVAMPPDQSYPEGVKPARLVVTFALEGSEAGPPGVKLRVKAIDAQGKTIREDNMALAGQSNRIVWMYPPLAEGGKIEAVAEIEGAEPLTEQVESPAANSEVAFTFKAPRTIAGTVMAEQGKTPAAGMKVTARRSDGFQLSTAVDDEGQFKLAALPGSYRIVLEGTDDFAPVHNGPRTPASLPTVEVAADADPEPLTLAACRTVDVTGQLLDAEGNPVAEGEVMGPSGDRVPTDKEGKFTLAAAPTEGEYDVYGIAGGAYGRLHVVAGEANEPLKVKIGEGMEGSAVRRGVAAGQKAPTFEVTDLASAQESTWEAPADRETLVVFGSLWHPASRDFVTAADGWSQRNKVDLQVVSCDWSLAQAKREADRLNLKSPISFGGAGGMNALKAWGNSAAPLAALISKEGTISKVFKPGDF